MLDLSVVIVSFNSSHFIQLCLDALHVALADMQAEVIVVDNQSTDDSCEVIKKMYPWVVLVENQSNDGFGKANNLAFALAHGEYILALNPDTIVSKETIESSLKLLRQDEKIGAVGVKMLDGSGLFLPESKRGLPTPQVAFFKAFGLAKLFPRSPRFARYYLGHLPHDEVAEIEVLAGAYMMMRADVLEQCQGFDEDFFMYGEDIDLSFRISQKGYRIMYDPRYPILHFKGESAGRDVVWAQRFYDAMRLFAEKHFSRQGVLLSKMIDWGISLRKLMGHSSSPSQEPLDFSQQILYIVTSKEKVLEKPFFSRFRSYKIYPPVHISLPEGACVLFEDDIEVQQAINLIHHYGKAYRYFFQPQDASFVMTSPQSDTCGLILS